MCDKVIPSLATIPIELVYRILDNFDQLTIFFSVRIHRNNKQRTGFRCMVTKNEKGELLNANEESSSEKETRKEKEVTGFRFPGSKGDGTNRPLFYFPQRNARATAGLVQMKRFQ